MDTFTEYMVAKRKNASDWLKIFAAIVGALALSVALGFVAAISDSMLFMLWFALFVVAWYGVYVIISRQNIEYEYTFTNGELDVDAIYSKRRRVHILTVRVRTFDICAPVFDEKYKDRYLAAKNIKYIYKVASSMESERLYFADFLQNGDTVRLCFEPSDKMIEGIQRFNPKNVYIRQ